MMNNLLDFFLKLLSQFAGGPGLMENNLVRFILPAILWGALSTVAWLRQREKELPREQLLVWGFGLGAASALLMAVFVSLQMMDVIEREAIYPYLVPLDRALAMAAIVVVAGAFLRYILDDARLASRYLLLGLGTTSLCLMVAFWYWPRSLATVSEANFHTIWGAWLFEVSLSILIVIAIILLRRKGNWLSNVVTIALLFFLGSEVLTMVNYGTNKSFSHIICPIGNSLRILAIPLLGYVYLREQAIDKRRAEARLEAYRHHLEGLVEERTAEIAAANAQLAQLHQMSVILTSTLNSASIYEQIAEQSLELLDCQTAFILDWREERRKIAVVATAGMSPSECASLEAMTAVPDSLQELAMIQRSIAIDDARNDPMVLPGWLAEFDVRGLLCIPIRGMAETLGTLFLIDRLSKRHWRSEELELIESFVNRAAVALMNANLCRELEWSAALEERQRIAADMHDGLAQTVSLLGLQVEEVIDLIQTGSERQAIYELATMRDVVDQALVDVRRSIANLQGTPKPERSIQELLAEFPAQLAVGDGPAVELILEVQEPLFLPPEHQGQALFIVQEALVNAQRHARATRINLVLECVGREARIIVADDGVGFDPDTWWESNQDHFGLAVIHARASRIGARLQIDSAPGKGTCVSLILPLAANPRRRHPIWLDSAPWIASEDKHIEKTL